MSVFWMVTLVYEVRDLIFGKSYRWYGK